MSVTTHHMSLMSPFLASVSLWLSPLDILFIPMLFLLNLFKSQELNRTRRPCSIFWQQWTWAHCAYFVFSGKKTEKVLLDKTCVMAPNTLLPPLGLSDNFLQLVRNYSFGVILGILLRNSWFALTIQVPVQEDQPDGRQDGTGQGVGSWGVIAGRLEQWLESSHRGRSRRNRKRLFVGSQGILRVDLIGCSTS